eukprot:TRINITY_DN9610_c0_g1_i1.p4 TRINITY_DN9610_c0_g1~~TRINITY_DN9610_c0_g1_i1.p4  ORF type:complete len:108 (+),score=15.47 TRINITY_DN9610_c0_g1_i1:589-912(+)
MIRLFKHYIPHAVLLLGLLDLGLLVLASELAWQWRAHQIDMDIGTLGRFAPATSVSIPSRISSWPTCRAIWKRRAAPGSISDSCNWRAWRSSRCTCRGITSAGRMRT